MQIAQPMDDGRTTPLTKLEYDDVCTRKCDRLCFVTSLGQMIFAVLEYKYRRYRQNWQVFNIYICTSGYQYPEMLSRPGSPRPRPDQDQDQHGQDQDQHPRPRPLLSWSRPRHTNSFHSSTFEYCTAVNVTMHKNIEIGLSNNKYRK